MKRLKKMNEWNIIVLILRRIKTTALNIIIRLLLVAVDVVVPVDVEVARSSFQVTSFNSSFVEFGFYVD